MPGREGREWLYAAPKRREERDEGKEIEWRKHDRELKFRAVREGGRGGSGWQKRLPNLRHLRAGGRERRGLLNLS